MDPLFGVFLADLDGQNLRFCERLGGGGGIGRRLHLRARVLPFGIMASPLVRKTKQQQQLHNYFDDCRRVSPTFDEIRTCGF